MKQQGFTLFELMIVVTIIGILATFAFPAYQTYTKRTHVLEGFKLSLDLKSAMIDYYTTKGVFPDSNEAMSYPPKEQIHGASVRSVEVVKNEINVTYNEKFFDNGVLTFTVNQSEGSFRWKCTASTDIPSAYLPADCTDNNP